MSLYPANLVSQSKQASENLHNLLIIALLLLCHLRVSISMLATLFANLNDPTCLSLPHLPKNLLISLLRHQNIHHPLHTPPNAVILHHQMQFPQHRIYSPFLDPLLPHIPSPPHKQVQALHDLPQHPRIRLPYLLRPQIL